MVLLGQPSEIGPGAGVERPCRKHHAKAYETPARPTTSQAPREGDRQIPGAAATGRAGQRISGPSEIRSSISLDVAVRLR